MQNKPNLVRRRRIANDPAVEAERFTEACFVERFGRRRQSRPKTSMISVNPVILSHFSSCSSYLRGEKIREICVNPWLMNYLCAYKAPFCAFLWLKNPRNPCNPRLKNPIILSNLSSCLRALRGEITPEISVKSWLIKDLRSTKDYVRNYKPFFAKRTQFPKSQMNVTKVLTNAYEERTLGERGKKQSQTNPNSKRPK